ncbi:response regulator [Flavobacterium sp. RHBU_3]|uniref:response regulator n=1 Tax=Flavobacterium sp. RHBU_3 TaxID=3391184 RepID=UPI003984FEEE
MEILLVDDHPFTIEGYQNVMNNTFVPQPFITVAGSCDTAWEAIQRIQVGKSFNLAVIDQSLPPSPQHKLNNGTDIALLLRKVMPDCKIIMVTAHNEILVLYDIFKKAEPEGFITKSELTPQKLSEIATRINDGDTYKSPAINKSISQVWMKELMVDDTNRQILFFMAKGYKAMELADLVFLSDSSVQKRIASMKKAFNVTDNNSLVKEAINQGFL